MKTLPGWAAQFRLPIDILRKIIAKAPELKTLGEVFGPVKLYTADEFTQVKNAFEARASRKRRALANA